MPYEKSDAKLDELIKQALADPEIRKGVRQAELETDKVYATLKQDSAQLWEGVASEITSFDAQELRLQEVGQTIETELGKTPEITTKPKEFAPEWMLSAGMLAVVGLVVGVIIQLNRVGWRNALFTPVLGMSGWLWLISAVLSIVTWIWGYVVLERKRRARWSERENREQEALTNWQQKKNQLEEKYEIKKLEAALTPARETLDKVLLEKKIKPQIRELINSYLKPSYELRLQISRARGLAEVFDPEKAIDTAARDSLRFMLENMPGGSIGIAGPRGAGKTTLLRLFCGPKRILTTLNGHPVLGVLVSAPVAYQARDFILYLFAAVCQSVLTAEDVKYARPALQAIEDTQQPVAAQLLGLLKPLPRLCSSLGKWLIRLGLVSVLLLLVAKVLPAPATAPGQAEDAAAKASAQAPAQPGGEQAAASPQPTPVAAPTPARSVVTRVTVNVVNVLVNIINVLEIKPGTLLMWGILLIVVGWVVWVQDKPDPRWYVTELWASIFTAVLPSRDMAWLFLSRSRMREARRERERVEEETRAAAERPSAPGPDTLSGTALYWLKTIKFQQSYTTGWSGALKLPIGIEGGFNNAVTLAENQLSLPELVSFFTQFVEETAKKYQVIIGIDELDKLESDEKAQRFLNDIKSIFGIERCFYLVSVSENAMSNFERRGLPIRDVFDSSFDSILYVDYLNFEAAQKLLEQRVVGRPIPFFGLSYTLSGGLARDLIRNFRNIIEFRQRNPAANDLEAICKAVVQADLRAKIRATAISAKRIKLEQDVDVFLEKVHRLEDDFNAEERLLHTAYSLLNGQPSTSLTNEKTAAEYEKLCELGEELATYIYYAATILQFFSKMLSEQALTKPEQGGSLDSLATARQVLAVNPGITRSVLNTFRAVHKLNGTRSWPVHTHRPTNGFQSEPANLIYF